MSLNTTIPPLYYQIITGRLGQTSTQQNPAVFNTDDFVDAIFNCDSNEDNQVSQNEIKSKLFNTQYKFLFLQFQSYLRPYDEDLKEEFDACKKDLQILSIVHNNYETFSKAGTDGKIDAEDEAAIKEAAETDGDADTFSKEDFLTLKNGPIEEDVIKTSTLVESIIASDINHSGAVSKYELVTTARKLESQLYNYKLYNQMFGGMYTEKIKALQEKLDAMKVVYDNFEAFSKEGIQRAIDSNDLMKLFEHIETDGDKETFSPEDLEAYKNA